MTLPFHLLFFFFFFLFLQSSSVCREWFFIFHFITVSYLRLCWSAAAVNVGSFWGREVNCKTEFQFVLLILTKQLSLNNIPIILSQLLSTVRPLYKHRIDVWSHSKDLKYSQSILQFKCVKLQMPNDNWGKLPT